MKDSQIRGGLFASDGPLELISVNSLFERVTVDLDTDYGPMTATLQNCLFKEGSFTFLESFDTAEIFPWHNVFDHATTFVACWMPGGGYNAFVGIPVATLFGTYGFHVPSVTYDTGLLGNYYLPQGSPLVNVEKRCRFSEKRCRSKRCRFSVLTSYGAGRQGSVGHGQEGAS